MSGGKRGAGGTSKKACCMPVDDDEGTTGLVFVGLKLKFPMGLVLRGEYQWLDMPEAAPVKLDNRYFFGVGLSF